MITIKNLINDLKLEVINGAEWLSKEITVDNITRPGLELTGYTEYYDSERVMLIGSREMSYLKTLDPKTEYERIDTLLSEKPPVVVFSTNVEINDIFIALSNKHEIPILKTNLRTNTLFSQLYSYLHEKLTPKIALHGVLMDIMGIGTLITGESGVGKSETALELLKRGHILISDDVVEVYEVVPGLIVGNAPQGLEKFLEIRGIGIIDSVRMFGPGAYRENKKIRFIVHLENWNEEKKYDRFGLENDTTVIFNTKLPRIVIPVKAGRNLATLLESAVTNQKLKYLGYDSAKALQEGLSQVEDKKIE
ncbi:MAG: HPr(Ser) kinase/phosphatase [Acholeplasmatales bacterium]|nr:HPr(Ser) kinase/phosphatase [Acholeplasmatales bacterium]